jgi:hypothetical protein
MKVEAGWYEFIRLTTSTTHVAYVQESGDVYLPEEDVPLEDFEFALAMGVAFRLVRAEA